ncbi:MAG: ribbon-helix-helix domain-containing protein [Alphaproteobacteria bacterium]|nr:ribbon-helix-helix domain-containing protein [Alphaproteobacteria bacterium]
MIRKRSVLIAGHATSVSIEAPFWDALKDIATRRGLSLNDLIAEIDAGRDGNLSSAIRVFVLETVRGGLNGVL